MRAGELRELQIYMNNTAVCITYSYEYKIADVPLRTPRDRESRDPARTKLQNTITNQHSPRAAFGFALHCACLVCQPHIRNCRWRPYTVTPSPVRSPLSSPLSLHHDGVRPSGFRVLDALVAPTSTASHHATHQAFSHQAPGTGLGAGLGSLW